MNFNTFKTAVAAQFKRMSTHPLFVTDTDNDVLVHTYLNAFPEGTNPIFRERTEHDCSCCKSFIRTVGNCVAVIDDTLISIWDIDIAGEPAYQAVADAMSAYVKSCAIRDLFMHYEAHVGIDKNFEQMLSGTKTWEHFFVNLPANVVKTKSSIDTLLGKARAIHDVTKRSLDEITLDAIDTVLELIAQNSLYRGEEHRNAVQTFKTMKERHAQGAFVWQTCAVHGAAGAIRNTVIGSLLTDLSNGVDLERAVKSFEHKVAPANYKRPTALVTESMVQNAKATIEALGLTSALERRHARLSDVTVNNVLFADRSARKAMGADLFDGIATKAGAPKNLDKVEDVTIEKFIADILPKADSIEVMLKNDQCGNLVSLIAPSDPTAGKLFKWDNNFSWSYNGEVADSIKEKVKAAGGNVTGDVCCRLAWDCSDDLDFHMYEPNFDRIYFAKRQSRCGGRLDVDANGSDGLRENPVENIVYRDKSTMPNGTYMLKVHQYRRRGEPTEGFEVEIEIEGRVIGVAYAGVVKQSAFIDVAKITVEKGAITVEPLLPATTSVRTVWGVQTNTFQRVSTMMLSPNHWDGQGVGNKHYFFMLDGCKHDGFTRGFFNEFLKSDFEPHRKVFEVVGSKMRVPQAVEQLSGLGFSSTQRNSLICRVKGSFSRIINITF